MASTPEERSAAGRTAAAARWKDHVPLSGAEYMRQWRAANPERNLENERHWRETNLDKAREKVRRWQVENPEKVRESAQRSRHQGMRPEDIARMYETQQGRCYLCGDLLPAERRKWHIDHDHRHCPQGTSCRHCRRGLACNNCNTLIGFAYDDPERLRRIAANLETALADVTHRLAEQAVQGALFELGDAGEAS